MSKMSTTGILILCAQLLLVQIVVSQTLSVRSVGSCKIRKDSGSFQVNSRSAIAPSGISISNNRISLDLPCPSPILTNAPRYPVRQGNYCSF